MGHPAFALIYALAYFYIPTASSEIQVKFLVAENVPVGTFVGKLGPKLEGSEGGTKNGRPTFLFIHPPEYSADQKFSIDEISGEIKTRQELDYEARNSYVFLAIPTDGSSAAIKVTVEILDVNDNAPKFPVRSFDVQISEWAKIHSEIPLPPAIDLDQGDLGVQRYEIIAGDPSNQTFGLSYPKPGTKMRLGSKIFSYLNLVLTRNLDRELLAGYSLLIRCWDGGQEPLSDDLVVNVTVLDSNDNSPIFEKNQYDILIGPDFRVRTNLTQIRAIDRDSGKNGEIEYFFDYSNVQRGEFANLLTIDRKTGWISLKNEKLSEKNVKNEFSEFLVVARDMGLPPLESSAKVFVNYSYAPENADRGLSVQFLTPLPDGISGSVPEDAPLGTIVAKLFFAQPIRQKTVESSLTNTNREKTAKVPPGSVRNVTMTGADGSFRLDGTDSMAEMVYVVVDGSLDRERLAFYMLNIAAVFDGSTAEPSKNSAVIRRLQIIVTDVNDNAPRFSKEIYAANLRENAAPGTLITKVTAYDLDQGVNAEISYSFENSSNESIISKNGLFQIDKSTGFISTIGKRYGLGKIAKFSSSQRSTKSIDCDQSSNFELIVRATDHGQKPMTSRATVLIDILGLNDNEPFFDRPTYNVTIREDAKKGTCFLQILATDPDCGLNGKIKYALRANSKFDQIFWINSDTGSTCLNGSIDFEIKRRYQMSVTAQDGGGLMSYSSVVILIEDVNDNAPVFLPSRYNVSLRQNTPLGQAVVVVRATDEDSALFGSVRYKIVSPLDDNHSFRIDAETGEIFVNAQLAPTIYDFHVSAVDGGQLESVTVATVRLTVITSDYSSPVFERRSYVATVREDTLPGIVVEQCKAYGLHPLVYSIQGGDPDQRFDIDPTSGKIALKKRLDHGSFLVTPHSYLLNVQVSSGYPPVYNNTQLRIDVADGNNYAPLFDGTIYHVSLPENFATMTPFFYLSATDQDRGQNRKIRYRLMNNQRGQFLLHVITGELKLAQNLDFEQNRNHTLFITALDGGIPPKSINVTVVLHVTDVNDNSPAFDRSGGGFEFTVEENGPIGVEFGRLLASDKDSGANGRLTFEIRPDSTGAKNAVFSKQEIFGIYPDTGVLYAKIVLDRESTERYWFAVLVRDHGRPSRTVNGTLKITVTDKNDNAPVCQNAASLSLQYDVEENLPVRLKLGEILANDADFGENSRLNYTLMDDFSKKFSVDHNGILYAEKPLDREDSDLYNLRIKVADNGQPPMFTVCERGVHVTDVNDHAPIFVLPRAEAVSFREQQPSGSEVFQAKAHDLDQGSNGTVTYALEKLAPNSTPADLPFDINADSGIVTSKRPLDYEADPKIFKFFVVAQDQGTPVRRRTKKSISVHLIDVPDGGVARNESVTFRLSENLPIGTIVGKLDKNSTENIETDTDCDYILTSGNSYGIFDIEKATGTIYLAKKLDYESQTFHYLTIDRRNLSENSKFRTFGHLQSRIHVKIVVLDENDNSPVFNEDPIIFSVSEDAPINKILYTLNATDLDGGAFGRLSYSLEPEPLAFAPATPAIGADGEFYRLDASTSPSRSFARVRNFGFNDRTDDNGEDWLCRASDVFSIDDATGDVRVLGRLNFERCAEYAFVAAAEDRAPSIDQRRKTRVAARVYVTDVNDNAPRFVNGVGRTGDDRRTVYVMEDEPPGYPVAYVSAIDDDWLENGRLTYDLRDVGIAASEIFRLNETTGLLTIARRLSRNDPRTFSLVMVAKDHGIPPLSTAQYLVINVLNVKNDWPRFDQSAYAANLTENSAPGMLLVKLKARHPSKHAVQDENSGLLYYLSPRGKTFGFHVDEKTGVLTTKIVFDREYRSEYFLTAYVKDPDYPSQYDVATIIVQILDLNDNPPLLAISSCRPLSVPENRPVKNLAIVIASDPDAGSNGQIFYSITGGNIGSKFQIDPLTGVLSCHTLDRELVPAYNLTISAVDHAPSKPLVDFCWLLVNVQDENDEAPAFDRVVYSFNVAEDAAVGSAIGRQVRAIDKDKGSNGRVTYTLLNDTTTTFDVEEGTGQLRLRRPLDFELKQNYTFWIEATDQGSVESKKSMVQIKIDISDANDNAPIFDHTVLNVKIDKFLSAGQRVTKISATDEDASGPNSDIGYSFSSDHDVQNFSLNPMTGVISAKKNLHLPVGSVFYLHVIAKDKGQPQTMQSQGIVRVLVALNAESENLPNVGIQFEQPAYEAEIMGHAPSKMGLTLSRAGRTPSQVEVVKVAIDGPVRGVEYSFYAGNEDESFGVDQKTGRIFVTNSTIFDTEIFSTRRLIVQAKANFKPEDGSSSNLAYTGLKINIKNSNYDAPQFTQIRYRSSIREGSPRGTFVAQLLTNYQNEVNNAELTYSIIGGNLDRAFIVDNHGLVTTNVELDREIIDRYTLTVSATDYRNPSKSVNTAIEIRVLDTNDNSPKFPSNRIIELSESAEVGSYLKTFVANDVDTQPTLSYSFAPSGNPDGTFALSVFTGRLTLQKKLDYEKRKEYQLEIQASDDVHVTRIVQKILILDENGNFPIFGKKFYQISVPLGTLPKSALAQISASDADSGKNGQITYHAIDEPENKIKFEIDQITGAIFTNSRIPDDAVDGPVIEMTIKATDHGQKPKFSFCPVFIQIANDAYETKVRFSKYIFNFSVYEDAPVHSIVGRIKTEPLSNYSIFTVDQSGNENETFFVDSEGNLILLKNLDRENLAKFQISVHMKEKFAGGSINNSCLISVEIMDVNDNAPKFENSSYEITLTDRDRKNQYQNLIRINATDKDSGDNGKIAYEISSGMHSDLFQIGPDSGVLVLKDAKSLMSRDLGNRVNLVIKASDHGHPIKSSFAHISIKLHDDDQPETTLFFPLNLYLGRIYENEPPGATPIFTAKALSLDGWAAKEKFYFLSGEESDHFKIDSASGDIYSLTEFDFEQKTSYKFHINVRRSTKNNTRGSSKTLGQILIKGRDEFAPNFSQTSYEFRVGFKSEVGRMLGAVYAHDKDGGLDGRVRFALKKPNDFFAVNPETGTLLVIRSLNSLQDLLRKNGTGLTVDQAKVILNNDVDMTSSSVRLDLLAYSGPDAESGKCRTAGVSLFLGDFDRSGAEGSSTISQSAIILITSLLLLLILACTLLIVIRKCRRCTVEKPSSDRQITYHSYKRGKKCDKFRFSGFPSDLMLKKSYLTAQDDIYHANIVNSSTGHQANTNLAACQLNPNSKAKGKPFCEPIRRNKNSIGGIFGSKSNNKCGECDLDRSEGVWSVGRIKPLSSTNSNNWSAKSSGRGSLNVEENANEIDGIPAIQESDVFETSTLRKRRPPDEDKRRPRGTGDSPAVNAADSGIHLFPNDFDYDDLDTAATDCNVSVGRSTEGVCVDEWTAASTDDSCRPVVSTRDYLASLGVTLTDDESPGRTSNAKQSQRATGGLHGAVDAPPLRASSTTFKPPTAAAFDRHHRLAALEPYFNVDDVAAGVFLNADGSTPTTTSASFVDGVDVAELIYSKVGEVLADDDGVFCRPSSKDGAGVVWSTAPTTSNSSEVVKPTVLPKSALKKTSVKPLDFGAKNGSLRQWKNPLDRSPLSPSFQPVTQMISEAAERARKNSLPGPRQPSSGGVPIGGSPVPLTTNFYASSSSKGRPTVRQDDEATVGSKLPTCAFQFGYLSESREESPIGFYKKNSRAIVHPCIDRTKNDEIWITESDCDRDNIEIEIKI